MKKNNQIRLVAMLFALSGCGLLEKLTDEKNETDEPGVIETISYSGYNNYLNSRGYTNCILLDSDVSDYGDSEIVGVCKGGSEWYGVVSVEVGQEQFTSLFCEKMTESAMYLVKKDGASCVLIYSQRIDAASNGGNVVNYRYEVFRFNDQGQKVVLDEKSASQDTVNDDATVVSSFFDECNQYLNNEAQIVIDPYSLKGQMWPLATSVNYGTIPSEPPVATEPTTQDTGYKVTMHPGGTLGYVQIKNPKSWLNLREGPGTEYSCVYLQPGNKKSIVKQAHGSPVTILETIETGDKKNPVWVKIRIAYAGYTIVGYSSKTYIREA